MGTSLIATLEDGTKVILRQDGTWGFADGNSEKTEPKTSATSNTNFDVRNITWGMSRKEVIDAESGKQIHEEGLDKNKLAFESTIGSYAVYLIYEFVGDDVAMLSIVPQVDHISSHQYIADFQWWNDNLRKKYGDPSHDKSRWFSDDFRDDESEWGTALSLGDLFLGAEWDLPRTTIEHLMSGLDDGITQNIWFSCKDRKKIIASDNEQQVLDSL